MAHNYKKRTATRNERLQETNGYKKRTADFVRISEVCDITRIKGDTKN